MGQAKYFHLRKTPLLFPSRLIKILGQAKLFLLNDLQGGDKLFYTTGRLTSEMVIKVALMGIPVLLSRSGITRMGLDIAQKVGVTLIARAKGRHFLVYHGREFIEFDAVPTKPLRSAR